MKVPIFGGKPTNETTAARQPPQNSTNSFLSDHGSVVCLAESQYRKHSPNRTRTPFEYKTRHSTPRITCKRPFKTLQKGGHPQWAKIGDLSVLQSDLRNDRKRGKWTGATSKNVQNQCRHFLHLCAVHQFPAPVGGSDNLCGDTVTFSIEAPQNILRDTL